MKNNKFSFRRTGLLLRRIWSEEHRYLFILCGICYGAMCYNFIMETIRKYIVWEPSLTAGKCLAEQESSIDVAWFNHLFTALSFFAFFAILVGSRFMRGMHTKEGFIVHHTTPASPAEHFAAHWLWTVVISSFAFLCVFVLADYTRVVFFRYIHPTEHYTPFPFLGFPCFSGGETPGIGHAFRHRWELVCSSSVIGNGIAIVIFLQTWCLFWSTCWRKYVLQKNIATLFLLLIAAVTLQRILSLIPGYAEMHKLLPVPQMHTASFAVSSVLTVLGWTLAYLHTKDIDLVRTYRFRVSRPMVCIGCAWLLLFLLLPVFL